MRNVSIIFLLTTAIILTKHTITSTILWGIPTRCGGEAKDDHGELKGYAIPCNGVSRAETFPYFYQPNPSFYPDDWVNCSQYIDKDTMIPSPAYTYAPSLFAPKVYPTNWAASGEQNGFQQTAWMDYYNANKHIGERCVNAMRKHWCLNRMGIADSKNYNNYAVYSCKSLCDYVFEECNAATSGYTNSKFDGCGLPSTGPQAEQKKFFQDIPMRGCFTENATVKTPDCSLTLGYECLNGGTWQGECMGCTCPPGFGGYNCGRKLNNVFPLIKTYTYSMKINHF